MSAQHGHLVPSNSKKIYPPETDLIPKCNCKSNCSTKKCSCYKNDSGCCTFCTCMINKTCENSKNSLA